MMQTIVTRSAAETEQAGAALAASLSGGVVAFFGQLGAGKTTFVRGLCHGLGYTGDVSSPTFAIVHEYVGGRVPLFHFDMYRVETPEDLYACGYYDYLGAGILAIEWSEHVADILPQNAVIVRLSYGDGPEERIIQIERKDAV